MTSLKVSQIKSKLLSMFEHHLDLSDIGTKDPDREQKVLSRCLSALAIYIQTGCTEKDAAEAVWDGSDDNGIDAAYFDPSDQRVILAQGKWINKGAGEPEAKDFGTFAAGVKDVIEQDNSMFRPALHTKFSDIAARLSNPGTSVHLVVVTTGASQIAKHAKAHLDKLISALNGSEPDPIATYELMGLNEVYSHLAKDPTQGNVSVDAQILDWSYVPSPYGAYFGIIDGLTLKTWWKTYGKRLLAANIRHALGSTEVNNEIKQSASTKPQQFWYFNNGITLVAAEATKAPIAAASRSAGNFTFKGASIVNGAQTVSTLAKVDDASLGQVRVPIRVMLLNSAPAGFGDEVTRTNNLQNRVEPRDFAAQDPEQRRIRQEMLIEGIDYQFLRSEDISPTPTSCDLMEVTAALVCASGDAALAVQLKTGVGRFFVDITKAPYRSVFNATVSGAKAFNAVLVNRAIDAWIDAKKSSIAKKSGTQWGTMIHGNRILAAAVFSKFGPANLSKPIQSFKATLNVSVIGTLCDTVHAQMVAGIDSEYSGKFLAVLFKNPTMSRRVFELGSA